jgi:fatty acid amide hydrolase
MFADDGYFSPCPAARRAVAEAADMLKAAGATVVPWRLPAPETASALFFGLLSADGGKGMKRAMRGNKRDPRIAQLLTLAGLPRSVLRAVGSLLRLAGQRRLAAGSAPFGHRDTDHYWQLVEAQMDYRARFAEALDRIESGPANLVLCPAHALPAFRHGASDQLVLPGTYTLLANLTGYPAGTVPVTRVRANEETERPATRDMVERKAIETERGSAGLPVGVQVIARPWREHEALAAMGAIEAAARKQPDYPAAPPL